MGFAFVGLQSSIFLFIFYNLLKKYWNTSFAKLYIDVTVLNDGSKQLSFETVIGTIPRRGCCTDPGRRSLFKKS
jgi:hypothetical protein